MNNVTAIKKKKRRRFSKEDIIIDCVVYLLSAIIVIIMLYPFLNILAISLNDVTDTMYGLTGIFPRQFTLSNYAIILSDPQIYMATLISVLRTVAGTVCSVIGCVLCAYLIYCKKFVLRRFLTIFLIITMFISGGMIPEFILMKELKLLDTFAVYILPNIIFAFNVILILSFFNELPDSLIESARIDGASDLRILFKIMVPLSMPVIATVALFCAVGQWSSWFDVMLYNDSNVALSTLQYELQKKMQSSTVSGGGGVKPTITPQAIQATMTIIATVPILIVYPFLQKYFVKGITLGGVKG